MKGRGGVTRAIVITALALAVGLGPALTPSGEGAGRFFRGDVAQAHHGTWHYHQHNRDAGSCCVEVWAHSSCSQACNTLVAGIRKSGAWYNTECEGGDVCYNVYSPHRTYSYPVTVSTRHYYIAGFWHNSNGYNYRDVYYA